ncbi:MAG: glycoside hydrolase family 43 protein, partial [Duncaniella sp.]|nr:glycoside hydrolase family 43 protein [Duncaniella sp.]
PQRRIPAMDSIASTQNLWAPELFYDDVKDQFMVVYASCVVDAGFDVGEEDPKNNHRLYYVTTKDFETFSEPKLFYEPGFSCIDATLVKRGPEDYVMVVKDNTRPNRNIKIAFAKNAEGPYTAASEPFTEQFTEGPSVAKVDDGYVIYYDTYRKHIYSASKTSDFVNFTNYTDSVSVPQHHKHGTIFRAPRPVVDNLIQMRKK